MPRETLATRVTRLENAMVELTENVNMLAGKIDVLVDAQIKTEQRFQQTDERFRQTDERIDKLVSAIGEWLRRNPNGQH